MTMGRYINMLPDGTPLPKHGKAQAILAQGEPIACITHPVANSVISEDYSPTPGKGTELICVLEGNSHDAALYVETQKQFKMAFTDTRKKTWISYEGLPSLILKMTGDE